MAFRPWARRDLRSNASRTPVQAGPVVTSVSYNLGDISGGGKIYEITGTGLSNATVTFGDAEAYILSNSEFSIRLIVPAHSADTVAVIVSTANGEDTSQSFTYWSPLEITGIDMYFDADKDFVASDTWTDQENAVEAELAPGANLLLKSDGAFGIEPGILASAQSKYASFTERVYASGVSVFAVARWTATDSTAANDGTNSPLTIMGNTQPSAWNGFGASAGAIHYVSYDSAGGTSTAATRGSGLNDGSPHLIGVIHASNNSVRFYLGDVQQGTTATFAGSYPSANLNFATIGAGYQGIDGFVGSIGAVIVVDGVISAEDMGKLNSWFESRFNGTSYQYAEKSSAADWIARDGAIVVEFADKLWIMGGWKPDAFPGGVDTTNDIWSSTDGGVTWVEEFAFDDDPPSSGPGAMWRRRHTPGFCKHVIGETEYLYVIGGDQFDEAFSPAPSDVWRTTDGTTWEQVASGCSWGTGDYNGRVLHSVCSLNGNLYLMGGQTDLGDKTSALNDVWRSSDGGVTWTQIQSNAGWPKRGMISGNGVLVHNSRMWILGGGTYLPDEGTRDYYNDVWSSSDGITWVQVTADADWQVRQYHATAVYDGRMWVADGFVDDGTPANAADLWWSIDGYYWFQTPIPPWSATHAPGLAPTASDGLVHVTGNAMDKYTYKVF